jgi:hypothetical protein
VTSKKNSVGARIMSVMHGTTRKWTPREVAEAITPPLTPVERDRVSVALWGYAKTGKVRRISKGVFTMPGAKDQVVAKPNQATARPKKQKAKANVHDALVYLNHAKTSAKLEIAEGRATLDDPVYLFAMLALRSLEKGL